MSKLQQRYMAWAHVDELIGLLEGCGRSTVALDVIESLTECIVETLERDPKVAGGEFRAHHVGAVLRSNLVSWRHLVDETIHLLATTSDETCFVVKKGLVRADVPGSFESSMVHGIVFDQHLGEATANFEGIEIFFRGMHQICEVAFFLQLDLLRFAATRLSQQEDHLDGPSTPVITQVMNLVALIFDQLVNHLTTLKWLDVYEYAVYRPALTGTSGGGSKQFASVTKASKSLADRIFALLPPEKNDDDDDKENHEMSSASLLNAVAKAFASKKTAPKIYDLVSAIDAAFTSELMYWNHHAVLAVATIGSGGNGTGTEKLPIDALFRKIERRRQSSVILRALTQGGDQVIKATNAKERWVNAASGVGRSIEDKMKHADA